MLKAAIYRPSTNPDRATVVKTVAIASSQFTKAQQADLQTIENKRQISRVFTRDPLSPRQFAASEETALFSSTYVSSRCVEPVETCGAWLNLEALTSYKIIYSQS